MFRSLLLIVTILITYSAHCQQWQGLEQGIEVADIDALAVVGDTLYIAGNFAEIAGFGEVKSIVGWTGAQWDSLAIKSGLTGPTYKAVQAAGNLLLVGGRNAGGAAYDFYGFDTWDGSSWTSLITNFDQPTHHVNEIQAHNGDYYIGGVFTSVEGVPASRIARWDGTQWHDVGGGLAGQITGVHAMEVFNGDLYVGGSFNTAGSIPAWHIARWDGVQWDSLAGGVWGSPRDMVVDTTNNLLYVSGNFELVDYQAWPWVASWDGTQWAELPGSNRFAGGNAMAMYRGQLFVAGEGAGHVSDSIISRWDGHQWHPVRGPNWSISALEVFQDRLYVAGSFDSINGEHMPHIASYHLPPDCDYYATPVISVATVDPEATQPVSFGHASLVTPGDSLTAIEWSFGDGGTATGANPVHTYAASGNYTLALTVTNSAGCTFTSEQIIEVGEWSGIETARKPLITLSPNPSTGTISIAGAVTSSMELQFYSSSGAMVLSHKVGRLPNTLSLPEQATGLLHFRVVQNGAVLQTGTLVVE